MRLTAMGGALVLMLGSAMTTHAVVAPLARPASVGSQLIFYFDAREGFTTFASVTQIAPGPSRSIKVDFWGQTFDRKTAQVFTLDTNEQRIIDIGDLLKASGFGASAHGSQVIFVNFANDGVGGQVKTTSTAWRINASRANQPILIDTRTVSGVSDFDLEALLGDSANGSAGGIFFRTTEPDVEGQSRLIFFAEALGTFGTGYLLQPAVD